MVNANDFQYSRDEKEYVARQITAHNLDEAAHPYLLGALDELRKDVDDSVKKEAGKGLSTNDYTDNDKENVAVAVSRSAQALSVATGVSGELDNYVFKEEGKGLSSNDYTDADKEKVTEAAGKVDIFAADMKVYARQEQDRVSAEKARQENETKRQTAENLRAQEEGSRVLNESMRVTNENARKGAELDRIEAEEERIRMERIRVDAEVERRAAEEQRLALYPEMVEATERATQIADNIDGLLAEKVDKVDGKGLSTNDFTDEEQTKVREARTLATIAFDRTNTVVDLLDGKVDKVEGKGLSTNDYTDTEKLKVAEAGTQIANLWVSVDNAWGTVISHDSDIKEIREENDRKEALFTAEDFEIGGIANSGSNFNGSGSEKRLRMKTTQVSYLDFALSSDVGYVINVFKYNADGSVLSNTGFISETVPILKGDVYRVVISKAPLEDVTLEDYKGLIYEVTKQEMQLAEINSGIENAKGTKADLTELCDIANNIESNNLQYLSTKYYVGKGKDYETINEALNAWATANYPPATIYIANGEYNEQIFVEDKTIAFIGESKEGVIIRDKTGLYSNAPFKIHHGNVRIENMTVIADHSGNPDFAYNIKSYMAYAFHIDGGSVGGKVTVKNVIAMSYQSPAFGMGTIPDSTIRLENVEAYSFTDADAGYSLNGGAILCHMSYPPLYPEQTGNEFLELVNVRAYAKNTKQVCYLPINGNTESKGTYTVINSTFASGLEDDSEITVRSTGYTLSDKSIGNSIESLNN